MQYKVISRIGAGGKNFEPGELIDLTDTDAEPLLKCAAIELARLPYQQASELNFKINLDK